MIVFLFIFQKFDTNELFQKQHLTNFVSNIYILLYDYIVSKSIYYYFRMQQNCEFSLKFLYCVFI